MTTVQPIVNCVLGAAFGDAVGFQWEFDYRTSSVRSKVQQNGNVPIPKTVQKYIVSDDTVMHLATLNAINTFGVFSSDKRKTIMYFDNKLFFRALCEQYVACLAPIVMQGRAPGTQSLAAVPCMKNYKYPSYEPSAGGNGGAMRTMGLGMVLPHLWQLFTLVEASVIASAATHNHPTAILGGVMSAVFTSYAHKLGLSSIKEWPARFFGERLLKMTETGNVNKKIAAFVRECAYGQQLSKDPSPFELTIHHCYGFNLTQNWPWETLEEPGNDITFFTQKWLEYMRDGGAPSYTNVKMWDVYWKLKSFGGLTNGWIGSSGHDAPMMAYDALLQASACFTTSESLTFKDVCTLMIPAAYHGGDSDSTATIAMAWFGAMCENRDKATDEAFAKLEFALQCQGAALYAYGTRLQAEM